MDTIEEQIAQIVANQDKPKGICIFGHKWSNWSTPIEIPAGGFIGAFMGGIRIEKQYKRCLRCNKIKSHYID